MLFHELAHATRMLRGRQTHLPIQGRGGYGNIEEYFATVITNIYLSDKGLTELRGLYGNEEIHQNETTINFTKDEDVAIIVTDPLPKDWDVMRDPEHFYQNVDKLNVPPRQLMEIFKQDARGLLSRPGHASGDQAGLQSRAAALPGEPAHRHLKDGD